MTNARDKLASHITAADERVAALELLRRWVILHDRPTCVYQILTAFHDNGLPTEVPEPRLLNDAISLAVRQLAAEQVTLLGSELGIGGLLVPEKDGD